MKKILLVSPLSDNESLWVTGEESVEVKNNFPPLGLATLAAMTPKDRFEVQLWDEIVHGPITAETLQQLKPDLVGVTGYKHHLPQCRTVARLARDANIITAIGGPGVSGSPYDYRADFDILFINEAEYIWGQFLDDWDAGAYKSEYRQIDKPDLDESPLPCWDSIADDMCKYAMGVVQTTRGCPFDCEFCDVIYLFGRRMRHKPIPQIIEEVRMQAAFGLTNIFFCDDEFSGDRKYAKALLKEVIELNKEYDGELVFSTQMTIAVATDHEFLSLLAEANFDLVFMGIESPNEEALKGANKRQNLKGDLIENVHMTLAHGMGIRAGMIVGFDDDDQDIFRMHYDFIQESCLTSIAINMLKAPLGTPMWIRMMREGRVLNMAKNKNLGHARTYTNILPKKMTRVELLEGYHWLLKNVYSWSSFAQRVIGFVDLVKNPPPPNAITKAITREEILARVPQTDEARQAIADMMEHTLATKPGLMRKVKILILQHASYYVTICELLPQLENQIRLEKLGEVILESDDRATPPPVEFRPAFDQLFPELYKRSYYSLKDLSNQSQCLTEVFLEFLVRWGADFAGLEEYHFDMMSELVDRSCAKFNDMNPEDFEPCSERSGEVPRYKKLRIADDIYKNVWIELSELQHQAQLQKEAGNLQHSKPAAAAEVVEVINLS